jgi:hypothetical protein
MVRLDAVEFCVAEARLLLPTSVLHQKTTKCHQPNVVCGDQYAGMPLWPIVGAAFDAA